MNIGGLAGLCVESRSLRTMIKVTISTSHNSLSSAHVALWLLSSPGVILEDVGDLSRLSDIFMILLWEMTVFA